MEDIKYVLPLELKPKVDKWISSLRRTKRKQVRLTCRNEIGCCANGIGMLAFGFDLRTDSSIYIDGQQKGWFPFYNLIGDRLVYAISDRNDLSSYGQMNFKEIAKWMKQNIEYK